MAHEVKIDEAKARLPDLIRAAIKGDNVFIRVDEHELVQPVPVETS